MSEVMKHLSSVPYPLWHYTPHRLQVSRLWSITCRLYTLAREAGIKKFDTKRLVTSAGMLLCRTERMIYPQGHDYDVSLEILQRTVFGDGVMKQSQAPNYRVLYGKVIRSGILARLLHRFFTEVIGPVCPWVQPYVIRDLCTDVDEVASICRIDPRTAPYLRLYAEICSFYDNYPDEKIVERKSSGYDRSSTLVQFNDDDNEKQLLESEYHEWLEHWNECHRDELGDALLWYGECNLDYGPPPLFRASHHISNGFYIPVHLARPIMRVVKEEEQNTSGLQYAYSIRDRIGGWEMTLPRHADDIRTCHCVPVEEKYFGPGFDQLRLTQHKRSLRLGVEISRRSSGT